jgi:hypothetical protein
MSFYDKLKFNADGLVPAIIQDHAGGRVLMMAWMNRASLENPFLEPLAAKILDERRIQRPHPNRQGHRL